MLHNLKNFLQCAILFTRKVVFGGFFVFFALQFTSIDRYFNNVLVNDFDIDMCKVINIFLNKFLLSVNFNKNFISVMEEAAKHANIVPVYFNVFYITMITYYELYTHCSIVHWFPRELCMGVGTGGGAFLVS